MAQEITLPVKLQLANLQSIIKDMRSQLGTLKVDSSGYKKLEGVINGVEKRIQDIQVIASRPIMDGKQFISIEKDVSRIYDDITKLGIEASKIKFSDLQLTGDQKAKLQEFDNQLKTIKDDLKNIEQKAKDAFLSSDAGKLWQENNPEQATKSFSRITEIIELEVAKQKKAVNDAKKQYEDYQNTIQVSKNINSFMRGKNSLTDRIKAAGIYDQIFNATNGNFKNGGRNALEAWLKSEFSLSDDAIKSITQGSGQQVLKAFTEMQENVRATLKSEQSRLSAARKVSVETTNNGKTLTDKIASETAREQTVQATHNAVVQAIEARSQAEAQLREEERLTQEARDGYVAGLITQARAQLQMGSSCDQAKAQLASLNNTIREGQAKLASLDQATNKLQGISNFVNRYVGAYAIIRKVTTAIRNAFDNIKELDKVITSIAVVTNMSQSDLWGKIGQYTQMAQEYGVATKDVYTVSQIFYQQGLQTAQVMDLTTETLKMAKIAGIDYSQAANAMTVAVRAFRIEMDEAQRVTDTYSALAAKFAVDSAEIANAMEKTASSAASVGMSLESTSAFISVMEQTTRESAQNIGSALKSIISRYGEMKASPDKLLNVDGEEVAFNKVDTALASIGISIKNAAGQFRDFDDVIMELAAKWGTLDNNTQRYIATIMAGNRQQSRFIALVSNYDELSRAMSVANNAENASIVQVAKTMDSLESKVNQLKNAFSQLYLDLHIESGLKNIYDWLTRIITTVGKLGTLSGAIPTLMNIFGFGTGLKGTIKAVSDKIQAQKLKIETDNSEFERKKEEIEAYLANPHDLNVKVNVDDSQLQSTNNEIMFMNNSALASAATATAGQFALLGNIAGADSTTRLNTIMSALTSGKLSTEESRKKFLTEDMKMDEESPIFNDFMLSLEKLANSAKQAGMNLEDLGNKSNNSSKKVDNLGKTTDTTGQQTQGAGQKIDNAAQKAEGAADKFQSAGDKADSSKKDWQTNVMKGAMIFSAASRLLGTAITAFGASHQDKSTDNLETSKLLTGIGNGLSMAGTGAQLGMMTGKWWGPIIGAVSGFLAGGIGAIIDGLHMSLEERLALEKEEAKKASDEALKAQAKTTDISSQIDNIKQLQKAMYNSTEDMQAYKDAMNTLASQYPALVNAYDEAGNAIIEIQDAEQYLASVRQEGSRLAREAAVAEAKTRKTQIKILDDFDNEMDTMINGGNNMRSSSNQFKSSSAFVLKDGKGQLVAITGNKSVDYGYGYGDTTHATVADEFIKGLEILKKANSEYIEDAIVRERVQYYKEHENETISVDDFKLIGNYIADKTSEPYGSAGSQFLVVSGGYTSINNKQAFKDFVNSDIEGNEYDFSDASQFISKIDKFLTENGEALGISAKTAKEYFTDWDWDNGVDLTQVQEGWRKLQSLTESYNKQAKILNEQVTRAYAQEELDIAVGTKENNVSLSRGNTLSTSGIFTTLITNGLENAAKIAQFDDAATWAESENGKDAFIEKKKELSQSIIDWTQNLTDNELNAFIQAANSMDSYLSANDILNDKHFKFNLAADSVKDEIIQQFADANKANRDRIINAIYSNNGQGWELNNELKGLAKFTNPDNNSNLALDIAYKFKAFNGQSEIISKYADYFTTQLLDINELAEKGYDKLAQNRLIVLNDLSVALEKIDDSKVQQDLFNTITAIDFTDFDGLVNAQKALEKYRKENEILANDDGTAKILQSLIKAQEELIFNIHTLTESITEKIANASKEMDSVINTNKSGLDLSKALEQLSSLNISKSAEDAFKFNEIFTFDAVLGKYVYTIDGLKASIQQVKDNLNAEQTKLTRMKDLFDTTLSYNNVSENYDIYDKPEEAVTALQNNITGFTEFDASTQALFNSLANEFIKDTSIQEHTVETWKTFLENRKKQNDIDLTKLQQIIDAESNNEVNQYFNAIDWSALALGTDYYGTNRTLIDALAPLVGKSVNDSWNDILEAYLNTIENKQVREATRVKINDSIIQEKTSQYQTAISEVLNYQANKYLSQTTKQAANALDIHINYVKHNAQYAISAASQFLSALAKQIGKAGYTLEQYNSDAKSILDKTLFNQGGNAKALLDFASGDIGADALETLANSFGLQLDQLVNVATGQVLGNMSSHLNYNVMAGKYEIQGTFSSFISALEKEFGITIDRTSKQYVEALKSFNDAQITKEHEVDKAVTEELKAVTTLKPGDKLNLAQTYTSIQANLGSIFSQFVDENLGRLGADFKDGILTIRKSANIPAIIQQIAQQAANAGALIPDELAELNDALVQALRDITSIISSGIGGSISGEQMRSLTKWAADYGVTDLQFIETAEGYQLATESAKELYHTINSINSLQGQVVFEKLKDNLIATDERFKSAASNAAYIKQIESRGLTSDQQSILQNLNGNVDLFNRPVLQNADGSITTLFSSTEDSRNYESKIPWVMNITPVTPAGKELSDAELQSYIQKLVEESSGNMDEMIKLDKGQLGLIIEGENTEIEQQEEILKAYDERAEKLHDISNAIEENKQKSAEELALSQKIAEARGLSQDDSFKFMEQSIPDAQNNPLNYWENWGKAYKAMNEASKTGKMDYSSFYNLVTEMGNLAQMTKKAIPLGKETVSNAETAAALIEKAAGALQIQADGSVKIDLSRIGVDFVSGADKMNANIEDGIHQVAQSQIDMLDSLIGLLETIVTMEDAFKEFNVDSDTDMKLDLDEIFDIEYNEDKSIEKINGFAKNWEKALSYLRDRLDPTKLDTYSEDLARGADSIKFAINGFEMSLADLIKTDFNDLSKYGFTPENLNIYQNIMQGVYDAIQSGDFTETNVKELIMQKLQNSLGDGGEIVFDMGNYTFIGSGGMQFSIDWDDNNTKAALNQLEGTVEQKQNQLIEANKARGKNKATPFQYQTTLIAEGAVKVEEDKGKVKIEGKEYSYDAAHPEKWTGLLGAAELDKLGAKGIEWENDKPVAATGTLKMGKREVKVEASDKGKIHYVADDGTPYDSPRDLVDAEVDKQWKADMKEEGISDDLSDEAQILKKEAKYQVEIEYGISSFALNSQSYQELNEQIQKDLEEALKSGNQAKIDAVIDANVQLAELKGLSSSEIEEKLGIKEVKVKFEGDTEAATTALTGLKNTVEELTKEPIKLKAEEDPSISKADTTLQTLKDKLDAIEDTNPNISISTDETVSATQTALESISSELSKIAEMKTQTINITKSITTTETTATETTASSADTERPPKAIGTVGLAKAQGTLMGELGPELVVSNGRYFVAGQQGAEFVDLDTDAIVFNHLQTEQLLKHGMSKQRGQAVTNERNAVAFAKGNMNGGPALASAKAVLGQLKQLRSMWQSLLGSSVKDLAGAGGGGGGGGGGSNDSGTSARNSFLADVERWYNWLQKIAVLEEKINTEEAKRSKHQADMIARGKEYATSNLQTLKYLQSEVATYQALADTQQEFFNLRRSQLNSGAFSRFYTFDENGQLKYNDSDLGYKFLAELMARDDYGEPKYSAEQQYNMLVGAGMEAYMKYDSSGKEITRDSASSSKGTDEDTSFYSSSVQAFWDVVESQKEEMQSLHDSINQYSDSVIEKQTEAYKIMKEIEDNQISVEDRVLKAIEDTRQNEIDELQKQRDAIEESANNLINGLSEQLNREKDMYSQQTSQDELTRLQRQLGILQNSGGSASQIASLQKEIGQKQQDAYFEAQQRQIDTLQQASQNELERLDRQIDLMTESLEYEKENGLLWGAVYEVMAGTPEQITSFITEHDSQYWGVSPTQLTQDTRDILFEAQQFVTYRQEMKDGITGMIDAFNSYTVETEKQLEDTRQLVMDTAGANSGSTTSADTGGGSGGGSSGASTSSGGKKEVSTSYIDAGSSGHKVHVAYSDGTSSEKLEAHDWDKKVVTGGTKTCYCSKCNHYMGIVYPGDAHFSQGGMVDYTGPAMVHGSKSKPESVLNAEQTKILRDNILSNKPNSLINLLQAYNNGYDSNTLIPATKEGVIIEQATVEMHVAQIANDYDASRAGEQALEKIMAIARKSQGSTRIGR